MPNLMVKNVPQELYDKLRASAEDHRRSINSEVIVSLEKVPRRAVRSMIGSAKTSARGPETMTPTGRIRPHDVETMTARAS